MSTQTAVIRPSFGTSAKPGITLAQEMALTQPRWVFSAYERVDCRFDKCKFDYIEPCEIHLIDNHTYPERNLKRVLDPEASEPEFYWPTRKAQYIAETILSNNPRLMQFEALKGKHPDNPLDRELLNDLQSTLLPHRPVDGIAQLEWLESRESAAAQKGDIYLSVLDTMIAATKAAITWGRMEVKRIRSELAQAASGKAGYSGLVWPQDEAICRWVREPVPAIASKLEDGNPFDPNAFAQALATANASQMQAMMQMMVEAMSRIAGGQQAITVPIAAVSGFDRDDPMDEETEEEKSERKKALERKQEEARARNGRK